MSHDSPLTSCLMPSGNNPASAARAVLCFQQQLWPNKELVIIDYDRETITPLLDDLPDKELQYIRYTEDKITSPGAVWNKALEHAKGEFVIHWEPSDWHHPDRINRQAGLLLDGYQGSRILGTLLHLDHPDFVHHPYVDLPSGGYSGSMMYRNRDSIRYPVKKTRNDHLFLSQWDKGEIALMESDLSWLIVRTLSGERRSRAYKKFISGYRNSAGDLARLAWVKLRGRNMVSHPRFRLSLQARESFTRYLRESKEFGLITSIS